MGKSMGKHKKTFSQRYEVAHEKIRGDLDRIWSRIFELIEIVTELEKDREISLEELGFKVCANCGDLFKAKSRRGQKNCSSECKRVSESKRRWQRIKSDPEKLAEHRERNRLTARKSRVGSVPY